MWNLFEDGFGWQPFFHQARHHMLKDQSVDAAHHDDRIKNHEQRCHRPAQTKPAVEKNKGDRQESEPDVGAQPALHVTDSPKRNFFSKTEKRGENKNSERDRAEC